VSIPAGGPQFEADYVSGAHAPRHADGRLVTMERPVDVSSKVGEVQKAGIVLGPKRPA
jgi:hypothetical protein